MELIEQAVARGPDRKHQSAAADACQDFEFHFWQGPSKHYAALRGLD